MRWPASRLTCGLRLAELAIEALPLAYADGLRLALDAHALLAAGNQQCQKTDTMAAGQYVPTWRRLLAETAAACRASGDDALAGDLRPGDRHRVNPRRTETGTAAMRPC